MLVVNLEVGYRSMSAVIVPSLINSTWGAELNGDLDVNVGVEVPEVREFDAPSGGTP